MAYSEIVALASETRSGEGTSASMTGFGEAQDITLYVDVTAYAGSGSGHYLRVYLEDSPDGVDWYAVENISISSAGKHVLRTEKDVGDNLRVRYVTSGVSPTFDVTISGS